MWLLLVVSAPKELIFLIQFFHKTRTLRQQTTATVRSGAQKNTQYFDYLDGVGVCVLLFPRPLPLPVLPPEPCLDKRLRACRLIPFSSARQTTTRSASFHTPHPLSPREVTSKSFFGKSSAHRPLPPRLRLLFRIGLDDPFRLGKTSMTLLPLMDWLPGVRSMLLLALRGEIISPFISAACSSSKRV